MQGRRYAADLLVIDEVATCRIPTAMPTCCSNWREVFPNATCVVSLVDRLVHHAEIFAIEGASYRLKEANERSGPRSRQRRNAKS